MPAATSLPPILVTGGGALVRVLWQSKKVNAADMAEALILIDMQRGFLEGRAAVPNPDRLIKNLTRLLSVARAASALVIHLQNDGPPGYPDEPHTWGWELSLTPRPGGHEMVIRKSSDDGFVGTELGAVLAQHQVSRVVLGGLLSEMCVSATARTALQQGLSVVLPRDAHTTYDLDDIPSGSVARVAEHALGDELEVPTSVEDVRFKNLGAQLAP